MLHRCTPIVLALSVVLCPALLLGQTPPPQYFVVCYSQANLPAMYFSGVVQGPATSFNAFRIAFTQFLMQRYAYQGVVACAPAANQAAAQQFITQRATALRNANRAIVQTGWAESAAVAVAAAAAPPPPRPVPPPAPVAAQPAPAPAAAPVAAAATAPKATQTQSSGNSGGGNAGAGNSGGANANSGSQVASILGSIFGTNTGSPSAGASGTSAAGASGAKTAQAKPAGAAGGSNAASGANQSPVSEISGTLSSIFGSKSSGGSSAGGNAARAGAPAGGGPGGGNATGQPAAAPPASAQNGQNGLPAGALGAAQFGTTKLVIDGCGRQDMQVACVTELTNQNPKDTLVKSDDVWKDSFLVDDRGDRHLRTSGFFLNIDGEQRQQLDISNGKTAKFILMFDGVPTKVQKVTLRSTTSGLDVEDISLIAPGASGQPAAAPAGGQGNGLVPAL